MTGGVEPGEQAREAIRRATAPIRAEAERVVAQATAPARTAAAAAGYANAVQALAATMQSALPEYERAAAAASAALAGMRSALPEYERAAATARAALADLAVQIEFSAPGLAAAGQGGVQLTVRPARAAATASRPLLSVPETVGPDTMDAADLRDLLHRLWSAFYAAASNPAVQFVVGTLINLVVLAFTIAACDTAVAAFEQDRENNAVEQQRDATAPPIIVQPAPVTVIPDQREVDRRVDERLRQLGVAPGSDR